MPLDSSKYHITPPSGEKKSEKSEFDQAYRLVPVDESGAYEGGSIRFTELLNYYWSRRRIVYWCLAIFLLIGLFFAFFSPVEYESRASIIPEYEIQDKAGELIESYGIIFGLSGSLKESRTPSYLLELYPYMINSISFQQSLMREPFTYGKPDRKITLYEYFTEIREPSLMASVKKYTIGLPGTIAGAIASDEASQKSAGTPDTSSLQNEPGAPFEIADLSPKEKSVMNQMQSRISASYQRRTGIVSVQAKMPEAKLAAKVVQLTLKLLQEKVITYKTARGKTYKNFLLTQQSQAKSDLEQVREELISFENQGSQPLNRRMELQSRYRYTLDRYGILTEQLQRIELTIQKQLQAFRVLDDITVPKQKSEPNRKLILFFSLLLGFLIALSWITVKFFASTLKSKASS